MLKLFSDIFIVIGYTRSTIHDFTRGGFKFIPNILAKAIKKYDGKIEYLDLKKKMSLNRMDLFNEYYNFLDENEYIFDTEESNLLNFIPINMHYEYPFDLLSVIIFISSDNINIIKASLLKNIFFNIPHFKFIIEDNISPSEIIEITNIIHSKFVASITLLIGNKHKKSSSFKEIEKSSLINVIYSNINIDANYFISDEYQKRYPFLFLYKGHLQLMEATEYNTYLNKRIFIDYQADIKHVPESTVILGNLSQIEKKDDLLIIINSDIYKNICSIHRNKIEVCRDCELRMICIDNRIPIKIDNYWCCKTECSYNPYICKWKGEEGYIPIKECGSYEKETGFVPDKEKISKLNKQIWGEDE
ncbi:MAG: hypothetical protein LBF97_01220 [Elusimicrobiota bacterium]|jgi:hypothetical protein|nr:hypothetical protein [Elusimicrobiota bacterium]